MLSFIVGVQWGAIGVAAAFSISQMILRIPGVLYCYKGSPLQLADLAITLSRPAFASVIAAALLVAVNPNPSMNSNVFLNLLLDCPLYCIFYLGTWLVLPKGKSTVLGILQMAKGLKKPASLDHHVQVQS